MSIDVGQSHDDTRTQERSSGFSLIVKSCVPLASFAQAFAITSVAFIPNVYISLFRGDAKLIGLANIVVVPFDIAINPLIGRLSDEGFFNIGVFGDVQSWGRRAPLMLLSIPICMSSCVLFWVGPESLPSPLAVAIWYAMARFLLTLGTAMFESAFQSGFTELFPSKAERVNLGIARFLAGLVAGALGMSGIGPTALGAGGPGTPGQRKLFAFFGAVNGICWLLAVPYACLQRRTMMKRTVSGLSFWSEVRKFWQESPGFRCLAVSAHFYGGGFALMLGGLPFAFEVIFGYTPEQVEEALRTVIFGTGSMVAIAVPFVAYMNKRLDPSMMSGVGGLLAVIIGGCHFHAAHGIPGQFWPQVIQTVIVCGAGLGTLCVAWAGAQSALMTWVVDEDQVRRAEREGVLHKRGLRREEIPARRDGLINSFRTVLSITAGIYLGALQLLLGALGYDGERFSKGEPQPVEVRIMMEIVFYLVIPGMYVAFAVPMLRFPLRGQRLAKLTSDYASLYDELAGNEGALKAAPAGLPAEDPSAVNGAP